MNYQQQYIVDKIDMETILSRKFLLKQQQLLEPLLNTNLDYAARAMTTMPGAVLSEATLCVAGESVLVRFTKSDLHFSRSPAQPYQSNIHFNVVTCNGRPQLTQHVTCGDAITAADIKDVHFSGHSCQDMIQSCSQQARALVSNGAVQTFAELHIICNHLSLIYSIGKDGKDSLSVDSQPAETARPNASDMYILKTQCRLRFPSVPKIEEILKMKCWIEQEKPEKMGIIACVNYLMQQYSELPNAPDCTCHFILQNDGEIVELRDSCNMAMKYYIFGSAKGVSMFPAAFSKY